MILYLDTSALAKLYLEEESSDQVRAWSDEAEVLATSRVALAELAAAVARRHREGDLTDTDAERIRTAMLDDWEHLIVVEVNEHRAAELAFRQSLRGFDAIHLAAALEIREALDDVPTRFSCFDGRLNRAAAAESFEVLGEPRG
jgi:predicted nucleic acid-binding protein